MNQNNPVSAHQVLADLVAARGVAVLEDAASVRNALAEAVARGFAPPGAAPLLSDAVSLGAFDALQRMLDAGAEPQAAVDTAGRRLASDRGGADAGAARWAVATLGYAVGRVPANVVDAQAPGAAGAVGGPGGAALPPPPPPSGAATVFPGAPADDATWVPPRPGAATPPPAPPTGPQDGFASAPRKSRRTLIVALVAAVVLIGGGATAAAIVLGGDSSETDGKGGDTTAEKKDSPPDIGGKKFEGKGYSLQAPEGWILDPETEGQADRGTTDLFLTDGVPPNAKALFVVSTLASDDGRVSEVLMNRWEGSFNAPGYDMVEGDPIQIDGADAETRVGPADKTSKGTPLTGVAHIMSHQGTVYAIFYLAPTGSDSQAQLDKILSTWRWK